VKSIEVYAPNPSLHESPEIAAVCPYCHPERVAAKTKQAKVEAVQALKAELQAGHGILDALDVAVTRAEPLYCTTGELHGILDALDVAVTRAEPLYCTTGELPRRVSGTPRVSSRVVHATTGELPRDRWRRGGGGGTSCT